jgi:hypothetical protein
MVVVTAEKLHRHNDFTDEKKNNMPPTSSTKTAIQPAQGDSHDAIRLMMSAWEEGTEAGISPKTMAFAALFTGLSDLIGAIGEDQAAVLMERLAERVREGEFSFSASWQ